MRYSLAYGEQRREICREIHVAERSLFLILSRLLCGFNVSLASNATANDIPVIYPEGRYIGGNEFRETIQVWY